MSLGDNSKVKNIQFFGLLAVVIVVAIALVVVMYQNERERIPALSQTELIKKSFTTPADSLDPKKAWITSSENKISELNKQISDLALLVKTQVDENSKLNTKIEQQNKELNEIKLDVRNHRTKAITQIPPPLDLNNKAIKKDLNPKSEADKPAFGGTIKPRIIGVEFSTEDKPELPHIRDTIPAGSFGRAILINGMDAPTGGAAQKNPLPVILHVTDMGSLPRRFKHNMKDCRFVGTAKGDLAAERAYIRLERISCVSLAGDVMSEEVTGYVTGPDGKVGIRGVVVEKEGAILARAFVAGGLSGLSKGAARTYTDVSQSALGIVSGVDSNRQLEFAAAEGVSTGLDKLANYYIERLEDIFPVIEIDSGQAVDINLQKSVALNFNLLDDR